MFTRELYDLTLTSNFAAALFPNITGTSYRNDCTMLAVARALLADRIPADENINISFVESDDFKKDDVKNITQLRKLLEVGVVGGFTSELIIHSLNNNPENNIGVLKNVKDIIEKRKDGEFETNPRYAMFFKNAMMDVEIIINRKRKITVVLVNKLSMKATHLLGATLPPLLPWYFKDIEKPPTKEEVELLNSLSHKTPADFQELIEKFAQKYDFRTAKIKTLLDGFETIVEQREMENVKYEIGELERDMASYLERYANCLRQRDSKNILLTGLIQKMGEGSSSEIMEYFLCNKSLHLERVDGGRLTFIAEGYLDDYDPDFFERSISNSNSTFYCRLNDRFSAADVELLLRAIWGDEPKLKVKVCAAYRIDLDGMHTSGISDYIFPATFENYLPNQHIQRHGCTGGYSQHFAKCMAEHNYIGCIEQCVASVRNINMTDSVVLENFMNAIFSSRAKRFIELPDGTSVTPLKALEWLKSETKTEEVEKSE